MRRSRWSIVCLGMMEGMCLLVSEGFAHAASQEMSQAEKSTVVVSDAAEEGRRRNEQAYEQVLEKTGWKQDSRQKSATNHNGKTS